MNKTALVTGGSRGIGRGICIELAKRGWSAAINYAENFAAAEECADLCRKSSISKKQRFEIFKADIGNIDECSVMLSDISSSMGKLSALINNAGVAPKERKDLLEMPAESFDRVMEINLRGSFFLTQRTAIQWVKTPQAEQRNIVFVSSLSAETVSLNRGEYCMSKAGVSMAVKLFAARLAAEKISVFEVRPGIIKTDMTSAVTDKYDKLIDNGLVPQKRWGLPEDVGQTVGGLLSGDFGFSTGAVIPVDGGLSIPML